MNEHKDLITLFKTMVEDKSPITKPKRAEINKIADKLILGHYHFFGMEISSSQLRLIVLFFIYDLMFFYLYRLLCLGFVRGIHF